jgi:hypothetical protein
MLVATVLAVAAADHLLAGARRPVGQMTPESASEVHSAALDMSPPLLALGSAAAMPTDDGRPRPLLRFDPRKTL